MPSTYQLLVTILTWSFSEATIYKEVLINTTTNISCFPNEDIQIQWLHTGAGRSTPSYIYAGGRFYVSSNRSFRLEKDSNTGPYHLVIPQARTEDAGLYECKEDTGSRVFGSTQLTVLGSNPVCKLNMKLDGYIGPTTCQLTQENMIFTCAVSFSGETPQMTWKILNDWQPFADSMCKTENGRKNCSLIIKAESKYDGSIFKCQTTNPFGNCGTESIKIHYFESQLIAGKPPLVMKNVGDKVSCSVQSNQVLRFSWTRLQGNQSLPVVENQELQIPSAGFYRCEVKYSIRNAPCFADVSEVNVLNPNCSTDLAGTTETTVPTKTVNIALVVGLSIGLTLVISFVVNIVLCVRCQRQRKELQQCRAKKKQTNRSEPGTNSGGTEGVEMVLLNSGTG